MRLKRLEVVGFKSFAPRTEIVFGEGITGIVGPNGSGKSNIADAVRWVLGEQSAKSLRGASMSDVIFNGTQKRKPLGFCEVSLVFDNEDRALNMDFAEIMVTRRVYRNGESEYLLNQAACRLKDVVDLFRDTGIGREGYSIVGQGRIDDILSRKSEDRRQVFEEAAGIVKFRARKDEADRKLTRTLDNLSRVEDILDELEGRIGPLEEQSRAAREYLELSNELKGLDLNLFLIRSERARGRTAELKQEQENIGAALAEEEASLNMRTSQRDACQESLDDLETQVTQSRDALLRSANEVHQTQEERTAVAARRLNRKENLALLTEEAEKADGRLRELAALREQAQSDTGSIEEKVAAAEQDLVKAQEAERAALDKESADETALEDYKAQVLQAINRISDVRNDQTRLNTMRDTMTSRLKEITVSREKMQAVADDLQAAIDSADDKLRQEQEALDACRREEQERQEAFNASDARLIGLRASAEKLSAQLQSDQSRWKLLDEMTREMEGYSQSVRRAIQFARERHLDGVHGVLAQLLSVPGRYETAIDMALGAAQQNIVTDNEEVAKRLIDYLRQGRFGRATFLPISAIRAKGLNPRERLVLSMPGCLGVASELIGCDDRYRAIVENLLGRTVIADSLENGIPIMRAGSHAFRLVTLEGDVMHSGGSMTGGSTQSRAVNLLGRERELKELTDRLKAGKEDMERMRASLAQEQDRKARLREAVQQALQARHDQEIAVARETEHAAVAREDARQHAERMEETEQAILQLQTAIDEIEKQLRDIQSSGDTAQLDRSAAEARIEEMQEGLTRSRSLAREAQELVVSKTLALNDLRRDAETARRDTARYEADRRLLEEEILQRRSRMRHMAEEEDADAAREAELTALLDARQLTQRQAEEQVQSLEEKRAAERGRLNDLLRQMEELHVSITRDSERLHRVELQMSRVESDLQTLQDRIWNTYGLTYAGAEEFRVPAEHFKEKEADRRVGEINAAIRALGPVNVHAVEEYASTKERYDELKRQQEDLSKAEADLRELIERLLKQMRVTFVDSFSKLQVYFSETFTRLFGGGKAELQLLDPDDPLNCGIEVNAQPPGKKLQLLSLLSGGERALTAIAILFAMLKLKPTPFCILDEIEAALDDANIGYYADYLREYSENTQFIVITHRKGTMERCNALYGVAMEEQGVSKLVSVSLKDYED